MRILEEADSWFVESVPGTWEVPGTQLAKLLCAAPVVSTSSLIAGPRSPRTRHEMTRARRPCAACADHRPGPWRQIPAPSATPAAAVDACQVAAVVRRSSHGDQVGRRHGRDRSRAALAAADDARVISAEGWLHHRATAPERARLLQLVAELHGEVVAVGTAALNTMTTEDAAWRSSPSLPTPAATGSARTSVSSCSSTSSDWGRRRSPRSSATRGRESRGQPPAAGRGS